VAAVPKASQTRIKKSFCILIYFENIFRRAGMYIPEATTSIEIDSGNN
jgi:hypothetical protein